MLSISSIPVSYTHLDVYKRQIYVFAEIMGILLGATGASVFIYEKVLVPVLVNYPGSLAYALLYVLFCWSIVHILYKKGIYVKI